MQTKKAYHNLVNVGRMNSKISTVEIIYKLMKIYTIAGIKKMNEVINYNKTTLSRGEMTWMKKATIKITLSNFYLKNQWSNR